MINDPKIIIQTLKNLDNVSFEQLDNAIKKADLEYNYIEILKEKDKRVQKIIDRLESDYQRITKRMEDKKSESYGYLTDYDKCRLKAYRTKTREIKEYIEKVYFGKE